MWKFISLVLCGIIVGTTSFGMIGKGRWKVLHIETCEDWDQYDIQFNITRRKLNRTHDCFDGFMALNSEINDNFGVDLDIYKEVDGGMKYYQKMTDESVCNFCHKYAGDNLADLLNHVGAETSDCPIKPNNYQLKAYQFDYESLPDDGIFGTFKVIARLTNGDRFVACLSLLVVFQTPQDVE